MAAKNNSRFIFKENRIPLGKKKENITKIGEQKAKEKLVVYQANPKIKTSKTAKVSNKTKSLKIVDINVTPLNTSLTIPIEKPKIKLSIIKELEESMLKSGKKNSKFSTVKNVVSKENFTEGSTELVRNIQESNDLDNINTTFNEMKSKTEAPEIVVSPFVCTTRGKKWRPTPRKPPKLSELFDKYEENNIADTYRKKLDCKTVELQSNIKYWTELLSENDTNIPQSIKDEIDAVCGHTKLLTTDKFMQMRSLIEEFDNRSGSMPITTDDLDGFWDMLLLQVGKLEGQFGELVILKENDWKPLQPVAKTVIKKIPKQIKHTEVKSKFPTFIKNQKLKQTKIATTSENSDQKNNGSKFHEMKAPNNTCLISSTPTNTKTKTSGFTPMLLKTMELSYVARRSGMTPVILAESHVSMPLKPALKNVEQNKNAKRRKIHFEDPKTSSDEFVTPENSCNDFTQKKSIQDRVVTPYNTKISENNFAIESNNNPKGLTANATCTKDHIKLKNTVRTKSNEIILEMEKPVDTQSNNRSIRRSSRLANKPFKNYKC